MRCKRSRIATPLVVLSMVVGMNSVPNAEGLLLPKIGSDQVVLSKPDNSFPNVQPSEVLTVFVDQADECCDGRAPMANRYGIGNQPIFLRSVFGFDLGQDQITSVWN